MAHVTIYTSRVCAYCAAAKRLLEGKGVSFEEVDVSSDPEKRSWLVAETGQRTVPQIFIDGQSVGGFQELSALDSDGALDQMLLERRPV